MAVTSGNALHRTCGSRTRVPRVEWYRAHLLALYKEKMMNANRSAKHSAWALAGAASVAVLTLGASTAAIAGDVYWSVGLSSPGVQLGVFSPHPVYVQPQPYYVQQQPVYSQPQVIYTQPRPVYVQPQPVYVQPRPVYVQPQPVVVYNGWRHPGHGWHHGARPYPQLYPQHYPQHYPQQVVQTYPVQYQTQQPVYGHGDRLR